MALTDAALVLAANAVDVAVTHMQLHSGAPGAAGTSNVTTAARVAVNGAVDGDGDITWTNAAFTGVAANGPCTHISLWSASTGGTCYGTGALSGGDTTANAAGEFTVTSWTETSTAS